MPMWKRQEVQAVPRQGRLTYTNEKPKADLTGSAFLLTVYLVWF